MDNHKLGVIVPYRNRPEQLNEFNRRVSRYLKRHDIEYEIIIVNQDNGKQFNRGMLLNIGFQYAEKMKCDYVVFHDVDMLPLHVNYSYCNQPLHLATGFNTSKDGKERELFDQYFGGVTLFTMHDFKKINGYSNKYWAWGYEDTDLLLRCIKNGVNLDTLKINNIVTRGNALRFNGVDSYVKGLNKFKLSNNISFFVSFYPDDLVCDHTAQRDDFSVFTIPGYDFSISYNSFSRYNFCTFDEDRNALYVNSKIKVNYKTNMLINIDNTNKVIDVYQDGEHIGTTNTFNKIYSYKKEKFFYMGVGDPKRKDELKYFKGLIDSLMVFSKKLSLDEIVELSKDKNLWLENNLDNYKNTNKLTLCYDANHISDYKLIDLSGNGNNGEIVKCEIIDMDLNDYVEVKVPYRRESVFISLPHEENGFFLNRWKDQATRWNQLRFYNEVSKNDDLLKNDGLSNLEFIEYGKTSENNITHINVGI